MKLKYVLVASGIAIMLIVLFGLRLAFQDPKVSTEALVTNLQEHFPGATVAVDQRRIMVVTQPGGVRQRLGIDPYVDLCSRQPGTCERERERLVALFDRSVAEGPVVDGRLRPYLFRTDDAIPGAVVDPLVGDLSIGYAFFSDELMLVADDAVLAKAGIDRAKLRSTAITNLEQVPDQPRLRPIMLVHGVAEMVGTPDAAAQLLSRRRMRLLAKAIGEDRFLFALPRDGVMLVGRAGDEDRTRIEEVLQQTFDGSVNRASKQLYLYDAGAFKDAPAR